MLLIGFGIFFRSLPLNKGCSENTASGQDFFFCNSLFIYRSTLDVAGSAARPLHTAIRVQTWLQLADPCESLPKHRAKRVHNFSRGRCDVHYVKERRHSV